MDAKAPVLVYRGAGLASYGFGNDHPFGPDRHDVFHDALKSASLGESIAYAEPRLGTIDELALFHTPDYIDRVSRLSEQGSGFLDDGDTPAVPGIFNAAAAVVGTTLAAVDAVIAGPSRRAFIPIAGLHHAARDKAGGFCVFNDCGVAIEYLRRRHGIQRVAYVDIDAHHGDGVFYAFENDPDLIFADIHEDGRFLFPGTGSSGETGKFAALGTKLNIPMAPGADDIEFAEAWRQVEDYLEQSRPEFIIFQCGADALEGDPITHLSYSEASYRRAAASLCRIADRYAEGRIVATGGGGYNRPNLALAWTEVVRTFATAA
jgi:acetoin utilization protein AcuC